MTGRCRVIAMKLHAERELHIAELRKEAARLNQAADVIKGLTDEQWQTAVAEAEAAGAEVVHPFNVGSVIAR